MSEPKEHKGGAPLIVLTEEQYTQVEILAPYLTAQQIADNLGISRATFFNIMDRDDRCKKIFRKGKSDMIAKVAQGLIGKALKGDKGAAIFLLKTQAGWSTKTTVEHTGPDGMPLIPKESVKLDDLPKEEQDALLAKYLPAAVVAQETGQEPSDDDDL